MVGCLVAAVYGGKLGRKHTIGIGMSIMIVGRSEVGQRLCSGNFAPGAILQASSYSVAQMIAGRVISGTPTFLLDHSVHIVALLLDLHNGAD